MGSVLLRLNAKDPITGQPVTSFQKIEETDPENLVDISPLTGEVINNIVLDFEERKQVVFNVRFLLTF